MKFKQVPWLLTMLFVASTGIARQAVHVERDMDAEFSAFGSFAISVGTSWGSPICEKRVLEAVTRKLDAAGWSKADEASADVVVVLHGPTKEKQALHSFHDTWHGWRWRGWGPGSVSTHVYEYTERTLVVDMFEARGKQLVWRGTAKGVAAPDPERNHARIEKALERMFSGFPPGAAGNDRDRPPRAGARP